jgi:hypothetical protein
MQITQFWAVFVCKLWNKILEVPTLFRFFETVTIQLHTVW